MINNQVHSTPIYLYYLVILWRDNCKSRQRKKKQLWKNILMLIEEWETSQSISEDFSPPDCTIKHHLWLVYIIILKVFTPTISCSFTIDYKTSETSQKVIRIIINSVKEEKIDMAGAYGADLPKVPEWLNKGDNAWQLTAATLVGLQSMPGLVILYASIVKKKWAVNSAFMALYAFAAVLLCWVLLCYKMAFGDELLPFWGRGGPAFDQGYLKDRATVLKSVYVHKVKLSEYLWLTLLFFSCLCRSHQRSRSLGTGL